MDYEQKYKEALERAKYALTTDMDNSGHWAVNYIFPELKEIEDERMRKNLYKCLRYYVPEDIAEEYIAWLDKQGETFTKKDVDDAYLKGVCDTKQELEKQGEQPTDKVEPKFKVGDWVILNGIVAKILDKQKYGFVGLDIDGKNFFCNYGHTDSMRLWSINDAKDGDVLLEEEIGEPFIYNGNRAIHFLGVHCGIYNGEFNPYGGIHHCGKNSHPATKEQRDLLFQKIKEAGYQWDNEKKELKKMEVVSKESEDERIRKGIIALIEFGLDDKRTSVICV